MRWLLCVLLLVLSIEVRAGEVFLIPENNPKPVYPVALSRSGITGALNVSFTVHADGSVNQVEASKDAHPDFVEASRTAVSQWRYKPWEISIERPAQIQVVAPMVFRLDDKMPIHANEELKKLSCGEVAKAALRLANYSWVDMPVFSWTRSYFTHSLPPRNCRRRDVWNSSLNSTRACLRLFGVVIRIRRHGMCVFFRRKFVSCSD